MTNPHNVPKHAYGAGHGRFVLAEVVNRDHPDQDGQVQIRVFGYQSEIPKEDLLWGRVKGTGVNALDGGIGQSLTGMREGTWVYAYFADGAQQPVIDGTHARSGIAKDDGSLDTTGRNADMHPAARDDRTKGSGDLRFDGEKFDTKSVTEYAKDEAKNAFGESTSKDADDDPNKSWSLAFFQYKDYT